MSVNEEDIVVVPHKYDKFFNKENGVVYAFLEVPTTFLSEELPTDATWSTKEDESQKTIEEYVISIQKSNDETKSIIGLMGTIAPTYRVRMFGKNDLQDWETWLNTKGYSIDNFLTIEERNILLESDDYE
jgi:hypothetical protein|tara:strand:+ start:380 stop:769 length:390 start_codon:yes stop_codon:yes gene_type:complete